MSAGQAIAARFVVPDAERDSLSPRAALTIVLAGAALLVAALTAHWLLRPDFNKSSVDGFYFATLARHLADGRGYTIGAFPQTIYFPLYPATVAAVLRVCGNVEAAAHVVNMLSLFALAWLAFLFLRRILGRNDLAAFGALFCATSPMTAYFSSLMISEALFGALLLGAACAGLALAERPPDRGDVGRFAALGALGALAFLTRPEALGYLAMLAAYLLLRRWRTREFANWAAAALAFAMCVAPWVIHQSRVAGGFSVLGKSSLNLDIGVARGRNREVNTATIYNAPAPDGRGVRYEEPEKFPRFGTLAENLRLYPRQLAEHVRRLGRLVGYAIPLLPFGVVFFLARGRGRQLACLLMLAAVQLAIPFYFSEPRFVMPAIPFFAAVEIAGAAQVVALLARWRSRAFAGPARAVAATVILLAALVAPMTALQYRFLFGRDPALDHLLREPREFAAELSRDHPEIRGRQMIAYRPWLAFQMNAVHREMPYFPSPGNGAAGSSVGSRTAPASVEVAPAERLATYMAANGIPYLLLSKMSGNDLSAGYAEIAADPAKFGLEAVASRGSFLLLRNSRQ